MKKLFLISILSLSGIMLLIETAMGDTCAPGTSGSSGLGGATGLFGGGLGGSDLSIALIIIMLFVFLVMLALLLYNRSRSNTNQMNANTIPPIPPSVNECGEVRIQAVDGSFRTATVRPGTNSIGRTTDCAIRIDDPKISGHHADLNVSENGYVLTDLNSRNGTFVNGERITQKNIFKGDQITIGETTISL